MGCCFSAPERPNHSSTDRRHYNYERISAASTSSSSSRPNYNYGSTTAATTPSSSTVQGFVPFSTPYTTLGSSTTINTRLAPSAISTASNVAPTPSRSNVTSTAFTPARIVAPTPARSNVTSTAPISSTIYNFAPKPSRYVHPLPGLPSARSGVSTRTNITFNAPTSRKPNITPASVFKSKVLTSTQVPTRRSSRSRERVPRNDIFCRENGISFTFQEMDEELREVPVSKYRSFTNPGLVQLSRDDRKYEMIKEMMLKTITDHYGNPGGIFDSYNIIKIDLIRNTRVFKNYQAKGGEISSRNNKRGNKMWLFHGSPAAREIAMEGFRKEKADSSGLLGPGIYFADKSSKSNIYTFKNGCPSHHDSGCYICHRTMLFCRVLLGKDKLETSANKQDGRDGFDGVRAIPTPGGLRYNEYTVYDQDQALPCYLITYTIKKTSSRYYDSDDD